MAKIIIDQQAASHISDRIKLRIKLDSDQKIIAETIRRLLSMDAPNDALGHYEWHIKVERIGLIILRGNMIRTVYSLNENYPNSTEYRILGGKVVRA